MNVDSTIHHYRYREQYTRCHNDTIRCPDLSWKSTGMLMYLLSLPENWRVNLADLANRKTDGADSTATALNELIGRGYVRRRQVRDDGGRIVEWRTEVREGLDIPWPDPDEQSPDRETPVLETRPLRKNQEKKDLDKKEPTNARSPEFKQFWQVYPRRDATGEAAKALEKALTKTDLVTILTAAAVYRDAMADEPKRFVAQARTWLNQERWCDEVVSREREPTKQDRNKKGLVDWLSNRPPSLHDALRAAEAPDALETSGRPAGVDLIGLTANGRQP